MVPATRNPAKTGYITQNAEEAASSEVNAAIQMWKTEVKSIPKVPVRKIGLILFISWVLEVYLMNLQIIQLQVFKIIFF